MPDAYSRKRDFVSQLSQGMYEV